MIRTNIHIDISAFSRAVASIRKFVLQRTKSLLALMLFILVNNSVYAQPLDGTLNASSGFFGTSSPLAGEINIGSLQLDAAAIYGVSGTFLVSELLEPGTYTRTYNVTTGGTITRTETIPAGKTGAYFIIEQNGDEYQVFNAWRVSADGLNYNTFSIDGNVLVGGALAGTSLTTNFSVPAPVAIFLGLTVDVVGGLNQECNETDGTTVTANAATTSGVAIDRIEWRIDGIYQGDGFSKSLFIPLGGASVEVTVFATDGVTAESEELSILVSDTTQPSLDIVFVDSSGNEVTATAADASGNSNVAQKVLVVQKSSVLREGEIKYISHLL